MFSGTVCVGFLAHPFGSLAWAGVEGEPNMTRAIFPECAAIQKQPIVALCHRVLASQINTYLRRNSTEALSAGKKV